VTEPIRTAHVLGGSSDIAAAVLEHLARQGLERTVLALRSPDAEPAAATPSGVQCTLLRWDAVEIDSHRVLVERAVEALGRIAVVICAVGMLAHHAGLGMGPADVDEMVRTNFAGPAAALSVVADRLVEQGSGTIVVLSSVAAARARKSNYVYGSSKAGLDTFAQGMADALVGTGVGVMIVRPGFVRSSMTEGLDPAPFATDPDVVAAAVVEALGKGRRGVVWVPPLLGPMLGVLRNAPTGLWRRIAGDR